MYAQDFAVFYYFACICLKGMYNVKPTYSIYLAYTQYTLALAIQILKLLLKLDIVSKPKPQNNHKCPMEATQII